MKEEINIKGIIYKATNVQTNETYIGATTKSIKKRRLNHLEIANRGEGGLFHDAIAIYGSEAFSWEEIDTANSIDELAHKEKQHILEYKAKENGYNSDSGGGIKKSVYQFSLLDGTLVDKYDCLQSAGDAVNATRKQISKTCLCINQTYAGYYWSYENMEVFVPKIDKRLKLVYQLTLDGDKIDEYKSVAEASRKT